MSVTVDLSAAAVVVWSECARPRVSLGAAPPQAIAGVGVMAATRSRRRMSPARRRFLMSAAPPHPAPRGARTRCPRRDVSARLQGVCERTVLTLPHGGLLSCCERGDSLLSPVPPPGNMRTASQA